MKENVENVLEQKNARKDGEIVAFFCTKLDYLPDLPI
jgi:hypothetical protein